MHLKSFGKQVVQICTDFFTRIFMDSGTAQDDKDARGKQGKLKLIRLDFLRICKDIYE